MSLGMQPRPAVPVSAWASTAEQRRVWAERLGPVIALLLIYGLFSVLVPKSFPTMTNLEMMARQTVIVGMAGLGMTLIMIMGGIDLSVGSIVALSTVVTAWMLVHGYNPCLSAAGGVAVAALCGCINGLLITGLRLVPFIATLGMMLAVRGAAEGISKEQKIDAPASWLPELTASLRDENKWMLLPPGVWLLLLLALGVAAMLRYTRLGRHIFAIGSNEQTARLCGVAVERVKLVVYTLGTGFVGLAGLMQFSRLTVGDPSVAQGLELDVIAAVVIGGGSLSGGKGSVLGTLVGALIMTVVKSGCVQKGIPPWVQKIITGAIIVVAVALDRWRQSRK